MWTSVFIVRFTIPRSGPETAESEVFFKDKAHCLWNVEFDVRNLLLSKVYLLYRVGITLDAGLLVIVSTRKVLRPAISTQVFLGFPVPESKC